MKIELREINLAGLHVVVIPFVNGRKAVPGSSRWEVNGLPLSHEVSLKIDEAIKRFYEERRKE